MHTLSQIKLSLNDSLLKEIIGIGDNYVHNCSMYIAMLLNIEKLSLTSKEIRSLLSLKRNNLQEQAEITTEIE